MVGNQEAVSNELPYRGRCRTVSTMSERRDGADEHRVDDM